MTHETLPPIPGLLYADENDVWQKIERFKQAGANMAHVIFDFDRTLTVSHPETNEDVTAWKILSQHLPPQARQADQDLFKTYRPMEIAGELTDQDAQAWWSGTLGLYSKYGVNMLEVERDFLHRASIRPYTQEVFSLANEHAVPSIIFSAGVRDVIEVWNRAYNINPTDIISTKLKLNNDGIITGWDEASLVHVLNKTEEGHQELTSVRAERPHVILVGDSINDATMASGTDDVLRINIFDPREDEAIDRAIAHAKIFDKFDIIIDSHSFLPLYGLMQYMFENKE